MSERKKPRKPRRKTPGAKNKLALLKVLRLIDSDTGESVANIRWRPHGEVFVEYAAYIKPKVTTDTQA